MARRTERLSLEHTSPGTAREVMVHRFGSGQAGRTAYVQASVHSDEIPAMLTAHHLVRQLDDLEAQGRIVGEIVLVPYANPLGLGQFVNGRHNGRNELAGGGNFNRNWPNLSRGLANALSGKLGSDEAANIAAIKAALANAVAALPVASELDSLRKTLASLAVEADIVLDVHCDDEALMHLYMLEVHAAEADLWGRELGSHATLLSDDSGGGPFDETFSTPWLVLAETQADLPIPAHCKAATLELRGKADVDDETAAGDARAICRILQHEGVIAGDPGETPPPLCQPTNLNACEVIHAPAPGILAYQAKPGDRLAKGDIIAFLIDPAAEDPENGRRPIHAGTDGVMLSRLEIRYVRAGWSIAKIVGTEPLPGREGGALLEA